MAAFLLIYVAIGVVKLVIDMGRPYELRPMFLNEPFSKDPMTWILGVLLWPIEFFIKGIISSRNLSDSTVQKQVKPPPFDESPATPAVEVTNLAPGTGPGTNPSSPPKVEFYGEAKRVREWTRH